MSILKIATASIVVPLVTIASTSMAFAATSPSSSTPSSTSTSTLTTISDPQTFAAEYGIPLTHNGEHLVAIEVPMSETTPLPSNTKNAVSPNYIWNSAEVRNVQYAGLAYKTGAPLKSETGTGPTTLKMSVSTTETNAWTAQASVTASVVSAAVGFDATKSTTWTEENDQQVPSGVRETVEAFPEFIQYTFEVWEPDILDSGYTFGGYGLAMEGDGIYFAVYQG